MGEEIQWIGKVFRYVGIALLGVSALFGLAAFGYYREQLFHWFSAFFTATEGETAAEQALRQEAIILDAQVRQAAVELPIHLQKARNEVVDSVMRSGEARLEMATKYAIESKRQFMEMTDRVLGYRREGLMARIMGRDPVLAIDAAERAAEVASQTTLAESVSVAEPVGPLPITYEDIPLLQQRVFTN